MPRTPSQCHKSLIFLHPASSRNGNRDVYLVNADGTGEQRLTSDSSESYYPSFSPDGLRIAYTNVCCAIYFVRRQAIGGPWSAPERLVADRAYPEWSPDGRRLAFRMPIGVVLPKQELLRTLTADGTESALSETSQDSIRNVSGPVWSANGRMLYFFAQRPGGERGTFGISPTGGGPRLLVRFDDPAINVYPGRGPAVGNGRFYFAIAEMESDIYVMDLVRR